MARYKGSYCSACGHNKSSLYGACEGCEAVAHNDAAQSQDLQGMCSTMLTSLQGWDECPTRIKTLAKMELARRGEQ